MKFADLFGRASARWIRYSDYDARKNQNGEWFITPAKNSTPAVYDPIENAEQMVVDALNIGLRCLAPDQDSNRLAAEICVFAEKYGLLGFMTALPTTPEFMNYDTVYLPKNRHIRKESMPSKEYAKIFFPFDETLNTDPNPYKRYPKDDGSIMVSLAVRNKPKAIEMCYQRGYAEPLDWLYTQFKDWAILYYAALAHSEEKDPEEAEFYRDVIAAYDGNVPSFHIEIFDKPTLVWDFHSLMTVIHLVFGLMITDDKQPLRSCKHCNRAFIATHPRAEFCTHQCKNKYNVYKTRAKNDIIQ
ncbi:MAG: hypothetical protein FWF81_01080 [Defluviitaleaceae bacterium]|nr:hypothetical protein [Defluviitaleaceae bacterium]